jgi:hypothetical protein
VALYADYSAGHLSGQALRDAGFAGAVRYAGTPGYGKNTNRAEVDSLRAAGLDVHGVFEIGTADFAGGFNAGVTNARALLSDANACGIPGYLFMSADQHLSAGQLPVWRSYLQGAQTVLGPRTASYGFSEAIDVAKSLGITALWMCGSRSVLVPGTNLYQRNSGQTTTTVSGVQCDINDLITPFGPAGQIGVPDVNLGDTYKDWAGNTQSVVGTYNNIDQRTVQILNAVNGLAAAVWDRQLGSIDGKNTQLPASSWLTGANLGAWQGAADAKTAAGKTLTVDVATLTAALNAALAANPVQAGATADQVAAAVMTALHSATITGKVA